MRILLAPSVGPPLDLAIDEALLEAAEASADFPEVLRIWEPTSDFVVIGRSSRVDEEVRFDVCRAEGTPIYRRPSGGAAVVAGPGCLMYAVVLSYELRPELRSLDVAHELVMSTNRRALTQLLGEQDQGDLLRQGVCDLTWRGRKFSGNSLRCKRRALLYHGTILYDMPPDRIARRLKLPPRRPEYRGDRDHAEFVGQFPSDANTITRSLLAAWGAEGAVDAPIEGAERLVAERYGRDEWNLGR